MPLIDRSRPGSADPARFVALVAIPTFDAAPTIDATLASVDAVDADAVLFLDHEDPFLPEHVHVCVRTLSSHPDADYVQTRVSLADPVHPDWRPRSRRA